MPRPQRTRSCLSARARRSSSCQIRCKVRTCACARAPALQECNAALRVHRPPRARSGVRAVPPGHGAGVLRSSGQGVRARVGCFADVRAHRGHPRPAMPPPCPSPAKACWRCGTSSGPACPCSEAAPPAASLVWPPRASRCTHPCLWVRLLYCDGEPSCCCLLGSHLVAAGMEEVRVRVRPRPSRLPAIQRQLVSWPWSGSGCAVGPARTCHRAPHHL